MTPTTPDPVGKAMDDLKGIIAALDPEHKIKMTKTEVANFLERAIGTHRNLDRCFKTRGGRD